MKTYNVTLRTSEYRHLQVQANSRQEAHDQVANLSANEVEDLTAGIPYEYADEYEVDILEEA